MDIHVRTYVSQQPALRYKEVVSACDASTLSRPYMAAGTIAYSDQWAAHNRVQTMGNVATHSTLTTFTDSITGVYTTNVESY